MGVGALCAHFCGVLRGAASCSLRGLPIHFKVWAVSQGSCGAPCGSGRSTRTPFPLTDLIRLLESAVKHRIRREHPPDRQPLLRP